MLFFTEALCFFRLTQSEHRSGKSNTCFNVGGLMFQNDMTRNNLHKLVTKEYFWRKEVQTKEHTSYFFWNSTHMHKEMSSLSADRKILYPVASRRLFCVTMNFNLPKLVYRILTTVVLGETNPTSTFTNLTVIDYYWIKNRI